MRRRYTIGVELGVTLADPIQDEEETVRALATNIASFVTEHVDCFPWAVDVRMTYAVDRLEE